MTLGICFMARTRTFKLRVNQQDLRLLAAVADKLQRSQADAIRFLVKEAAEKMKICLEKVMQDNNQPQGVKDG